MLAIGLFITISVVCRDKLGSGFGLDSVVKKG
jgi:hypothetical protein